MFSNTIYQLAKSVYNKTPITIKKNLTKEELDLIKKETSGWIRGNDIQETINYIVDSNDGKISKFKYIKICGVCDSPFNFKRQTDKICNDCSDNGYSYCDKHNSYRNVTRCGMCNIEKSRIEFDENADPRTFVECVICGYRAKDLATHYTKLHKLPSGKHPYKTASDNKQERLSGEGNPAYNHGGTLSSFSKKFVGYSDLPDEEKETIIDNAYVQSRKTMNERNNNPCTIEYYIKRGMSESEAKSAIYDRQVTFTLDKCIAKHGIEDGTRIYNERQENWMKTLDSKSDEEKDRILKAKVSNKIGSVSKLEKEILESLNEQNVYPEVQFPVRYQSTNKTKSYLFDFGIGNKLVEIQGDYWHCNPLAYSSDYFNKSTKRTAETTWEIDYRKYKEASLSGFDVLYVWESDYKKNKEDVLSKIKNFLTA